MVSVKEKILCLSAGWCSFMFYRRSRSFSRTVLRRRWSSSRSDTSIIIETPRLILCHQVLSDLDDLCALCFSPNITRFTPDAPRSHEETRGLEWHMHGHPKHPELGLWAAIHNEAGKFIGRCGLLPWEKEQCLAGRAIIFRFIFTRETDRSHHSRVLRKILCPESLGEKFKQGACLRAKLRCGFFAPFQLLHQTIAETAML